MLFRFYMIFLVSGIRYSAKKSMLYTRISYFRLRMILNLKLYLSECTIMNIEFHYSQFS